MRWRSGRAVRRSAYGGKRAQRSHRLRASGAGEGDHRPERRLRGGRLRAGDEHDGLRGRVRGALELAIEKIRKTREVHPEVVVVSREKTARQSMGVLPGEAWSWRRHCYDQVLPHVKTFRTLRRMLAAVAAGLDEGRMGGPDRMAAYFHHF